MAFSSFFRILAFNFARNLYVANFVHVFAVNIFIIIQKPPLIYKSARSMSNSSHSIRKYSANWAVSLEGFYDEIEFMSGPIISL